MKALIFDPFSGASGDMIVASLIDIGADASRTREIMESVADVSVSIGRVNRRGIDSVHVDVISEKESPVLYPEMVDRIKSACMEPEVETSVLSIFSLLAEAESKVHNVPLDELHFHEVGQNDAIADVTGAAFAINELGCDLIYCTPITTGSGYVNTAHGKLPVPAPATLNILQNKGMIFRGGNVEGEYLTPTGAGIISYFATPVNSYPQSIPLKTGYGAGDMDPIHPNVLRSVLVDIEAALIQDHVELLETNVDDVTGEVLGNLVDELMGMGARDVTITPAIMKKGRPGHVIHVIARSRDTYRLAHRIICETGSLGVRVIPTRHRLIADRRMESVRISLNMNEFDIKVKIASDRNGSLLNIGAEFEDCRRVSLDSGIPVKDVIRIAEEAAWNKFGNRS
ncbi:protein of unknown function DUF111 [Methanosalsum zhilinae DSM 4017]|uniref:Putative nickel insertion protein n=1 Tax=Methanosalsum zhilinae (strain DSM 4017 / NBRC 107636 / OCM 62 / WeN5) TaxID=679901 RepID=F7XKI7_METZD|nr:nickel pincer cofactor biosynthesis protein LarC [Methanosalsum zhilinae]AEH61761.1 protein of unknown function DUF111 [Methanosalsum zhilinae DSM 4017]